MEKTEEYEVSQTKYKHKFYCDGCGEFLGESAERDGGYYEKIGFYYFRVHVSGVRYRLKKTFCEKCRKETEEKIVKALVDIGFREEDDDGN